MKILVEIIGWYGALAVLSAYVLVSFGDLSANTILFQGLNFTGAMGLVVNSWYKHDVQPVVLNIVFACIGLFALIQIIF